MPQKPTWNGKPSDSLLSAIERANKLTMLITKTPGPLSFVLHEDATKSNHKVTLGEVHSCDCLEFRRSEETCVHLCWLLLKKFKVDPKDEIMFQKGLNENYLRSLFSLERYHANTRSEKQKLSTEGKKNNSRPLTRDDECPICFDKFYQSLKGVTQCHTCFNHVHIPCRDLWKRNGDSENKNRCPYCRGEFGAGTPIPVYCIPWRRVVKEPKVVPPSDMTSSVITEPDFSEQIIKGHSVPQTKAQKLDQKRYDAAAPKASKSAPVLSFQQSIRQIPSETIAWKRQTKVEMDIAGHGLLQFNSVQQTTGPILEKVIGHSTVHERELPDIFDRTISAIRHNQQVGMKGPAAVMKLRNNDEQKFMAKANPPRQPPPFPPDILAKCGSTLLGLPKNEYLLQRSPSGL